MLATRIQVRGQEPSPYARLHFFSFHNISKQLNSLPRNGDVQLSHIRTRLKLTRSYQCRRRWEQQPGLQQPGHSARFRCHWLPQGPLRHRQSSPPSQHRALPESSSHEGCRGHVLLPERVARDELRVAGRQHHRLHGDGKEEGFSICPHRQECIYRYPCEQHPPESIYQKASASEPCRRVQ